RVSFIVMLRPPPRSPLFPYTTLFRSVGAAGAGPAVGAAAPGDVALGQHRQLDRRQLEPPLERLHDDVAAGRGQIGHAFLVEGHGDRKSTRLNSSHLGISYAVFCLKKK